MKPFSYPCPRHQVPIRYALLTGSPFLFVAFTTKGRSRSGSFPNRRSWNCPFLWSSLWVKKFPPSRSRIAPIGPHTLLLWWRSLYAISIPTMENIYLGRICTFLQGVIINRNIYVFLDTYPRNKKVHFLLLFQLDSFRRPPLINLLTNKFSISGGPI